MYSLVYQPSLFKNTLFVYFAPHLKATHSETIQEAVFIFNQDICIGINVFNIPHSISSLLTEGVQRVLNKDVYLFVQKMIQTSPFNIDFPPFQSGFVIGEILEKEGHPDSEHLWVCQVNIGSTIQVVTNANQVKVGDKVVVALPQAMTAFGVWITETSMLKIKSTGMFCSEKTLGLPQSQQGVLILDRQALIGKDFYENLGN